jgi:hypothetical protein
MLAKGSTAIDEKIESLPGGLRFRTGDVAVVLPPGGRPLEEPRQDDDRDEADGEDHDQHGDGRIRYAEPRQDRVGDLEEQPCAGEVPYGHAYDVAPLEFAQQ